LAFSVASYLAIIVAAVVVVSFAILILLLALHVVLVLWFDCSSKRRWGEFPRKVDRPFFLT
jgi:hypothetical protein